MGNTIPKRFRDAKMEDLDVVQFDELIHYAEGMPKNLKEGKGWLLSGKAGIGKTHAICALTNMYREMGICNGRFEFGTSPDIVDNLLDFNGWDSLRDQTWERTYHKSPWLVLNDLGKESRAGHNQERVVAVIGRLLRARCERMLVTHVTTNLTGKDIKEIYGESITSLMKEMMYFKSVGGEDRRK